MTIIMRLMMTHWMATRTDTAYPPYWFFGMGDGPQILSTRLNTLTATGIHVPVEAPSRTDRQRARTSSTHPARRASSRNWTKSERGVAGRLARV